MSMAFLEMTLSGAAFILAIAAARALTLRRLPKGAFVALWWAAALRLLVPVALPSRLSVYTLFAALRPEKASVGPAGTAANAARVYIIPAPAGPAAPWPAPAEPFPVWTVLWLTVAAALALWALVRYVRWRRRFRESLPADCPGLDTCLSCRRKIQLRITDQIAAPLTYGLFRPVVLLPKALDLRDEEEVTCILTHELAHIRRLDGLFKFVLTAALCLHWFNPAAWLLYVLANRDMEFRCDEAAVLALGEDSRERYALALLRMAELRNECVPLCGFAHRSGMEERIKLIMSVKKKSMLACVAALALVLGITTAFATSAKPEEKPKTQDDVLSDDAVMVMALEDSVKYDSGNIYFTIPESEGRWSIFIQGRLVTEDGVGMSVHYLEEESERAEWVPRKTYSFETADAAYDELGMDVKYGKASLFYDLTLLLPEGGGPLAQEPLPERKSGIPEDGSLVWPVDGDELTITNWFGERADPGGQSVTVHNGVDIGGLERGAPIYAAAAGTVKDAGFNAADGYYVRLDHGNGLETFYAHCRSVEVKTGDAVTMGQTIAAVGSTGNSTGPHLHFEVWRDGAAQDPMDYYQTTILRHEGNRDILDLGDDPESPAEKTVGSMDPTLDPGSVSPPAEEPPAGAEQPKAAEQSEAEEPGRLIKQKEQLLADVYPTNSRGETYGSGLDSELAGIEPDLIAAINEESRSHGYISREDLYLARCASLEEAIAYMNWREENHITGWTIPLYDKEHNVIGEFQVGERGPVSLTFEEVKEAQMNGWTGRI